MGHPLLDEFCRVAGLESCRPEFFRRVQRELREQIQPLLDERESLGERVRVLEAELELLRAKESQSKTRAKHKAESVESLEAAS